MRKLIVAEFITLDGFIAKQDGQMDFFMQFQSERNMMIEAQKDWDLLLMGRNTYETMVHFWPNSKDENDLIAKYMNTVPKTVLSTSLKDAPWGKYEAATVLSEHINEAIKHLQQQPGKHIALLGSAITSKYLLDHDLVDEYFLLIYPIVLGEGKSLFNGISSQKKLQLIESKTLGNGVVQVRYKVIKEA